MKKKKKMNKIEIKPKSPKDETNTNTYPDQLSATERGKTEKAVVSWSGSQQKPQQNEVFRPPNLMSDSARCYITLLVLEYDMATQSCHDSWTESKRTVYRRVEKFQTPGSVLVKKSALQNSSVKQGTWNCRRKTDSKFMANVQFACTKLPQQLPCW